MSSVFTNAYSYRERKSQNNLENYLIEIFSFCFNNDETFQEKVCDIISIGSLENLVMKTQVCYPEGRPDIELIVDKEHILIECKIEHQERENQLNDYIEILHSQNKKIKRLVYLTKYSESKIINSKNIFFSNITWWNIAELIDNNCNLITLQLKQFLIEKNIAMDKKFSTLDLITLENITNTISKMDEILNSVEPYFAKKIGKLSKYSSRSSRLPDKAYFNYKELGNQDKYYYQIGFFWWDENKLVSLRSRLWFSNKFPNNENQYKYYKDKLQWEGWIREDGFLLESSLNVNELTAIEDDQIKEMLDFLKGDIDSFSKIK